MLRRRFRRKGVLKLQFWVGGNVSVEVGDIAKSRVGAKVGERVGGEVGVAVGS